MSDERRAAINRPMTDDERTLMKQLAVWTIAEQTGASDEAAADWLDGVIESTGLYMEGDARDVYIKTGTPDDGPGRVIAHATREWLAFFASHADEPVDVSKYVCWFKDDTPVRPPHPDEDK